MIKMMTLVLPMVHADYLNKKNTQVIANYVLYFIVKNLKILVAMDIQLSSCHC